MRNLPICQHCGHRWSYMDTIRNIFRLRCPYCSEQNFIRKMRIRDYVIIITSTILILIVFPLFQIPLTGTIMFACLLVLVYIATYPFHLKLEKDETPLF